MTTISDIVRLVRIAAAEDPDYRYVRGGEAGSHQCLYAPNDANPKGCIIGHVLRMAGHEATDDQEGAGARHVVPRMLFGPGYVFPTPSRVSPGIVWLDEVQGQQDAGLTWSEAVAAADHFTTDPIAGR